MVNFARGNFGRHAPPPQVLDFTLAEDRANERRLKQWIKEERKHKEGLGAAAAAAAQKELADAESAQAQEDAKKAAEEQAARDAEQASKDAAAAELAAAAATAAAAAASKGTSARTRVVSEKEANVEKMIEDILQENMILFAGGMSDLSTYDKGQKQTKEDTERHETNTGVIQKLAPILQDHPEIYILIDGHGDDGTRDKHGYGKTKAYGTSNMVERAQAVKDALVAHGVEEGQIDVCGSGCTGHHPVTGEAVEKLGNRRVYISTILESEVGMQGRMNCIFVWADKDKDGFLNESEWMRLKEGIGQEFPGGLSEADFGTALDQAGVKNDQLQAISKGQFEAEYKSGQRSAFDDFETLGEPWYHKK